MALPTGPVKVCLALSRSDNLLLIIPIADVCEMLRQLRLDPFWVGGIEYVDTSHIGGFNAKWKIHQPPPEVTSNRWYCVTIGAEVGVFASWYVQFVLSSTG